jgi:hypothetical protein
MEAVMADDRHPNAWIRDLRNVADDALVKSLVDDFRHGIATSGGSMIPGQRPASTVSIVGAGRTVEPSLGPAYRPYQEPAPEPADRSGWRDAQALKTPEGVSLVDQLVEAQDLADLEARGRQEAQRMGIGYGDWLKLMEKDLRERRERREKAARAREGK